MRRHTIIGEDILNVAPALQPVAALVRASHERWDGTGYPDGTSGDEIPRGARIVAVCDAFSAMVQDRPYQAGLSVNEAVSEIKRCAGTNFDPAVVDAFAAEIRSEAVTV
jgi:HD-GYP domain-containing protein (c-di-GMP phosphodiesterase class II)